MSSASAAPTLSDFLSLPFRQRLSIILVSVVVAVGAVVWGWRSWPAGSPHPGVLGSYTATVTRVSLDGTGICVRPRGRKADVCAGAYSEHGPVTVGQRLQLSEVRVPTADGVLVTAFVVDPAG